MPQLESISSSDLSFIYGTTLTSINEYWKNHSFDYMDFCWQSDAYIFNMLSRVSLVAHAVKNLHAAQETPVQSLNWEDSLEKGMATNSGILAFRIPRTEGPGRLHSTGSQSRT